MTDKMHITDSGDLRKYRTELPNLIDDYGLSVYAFRLYVHMKRVCGENGACWQSTKTLAEHCKMSAGMVSNAKTELSEKGLINIENVKDDKGGYDFHRITIVDIWAENFKHYTNTPPRSSDEQPRSCSEQPRSSGETKKEPIKKEPKKNNIGAGAPASNPVPPVEEKAEDEQQEDQADSLEIKATPGGRVMFALLQAENRAKKRRTTDAFPSLACKRKWLERCEGRLNGTLKIAVERALEKGITSITGIVDFVALYEPQAPKQAGAQIYSQQPRNGRPKLSSTDVRTSVYRDNA